MSNIKHGKRRHKLYEVWTNIKTRCSNQKSDGYCLYGGRGVYVCAQWLHDFNAFYDFSMANGWEPGLEIDRIDVDGPYSPNNCRFVPSAVNSSNRRKRCDNKSGYIGISWNKRTKRYVSRITINGEVIRIGNYKNILTAAKERDAFIVNNNLPHTLNNTRRA